MLSIGTVSSVDRTRGTVRVLFAAEGNKVKEIPLLMSAKIPDVKDMVYCIFDDKFSHVGICLGGFWHGGNLPPKNEVV